MWIICKYYWISIDGWVILHLGQSVTNAFYKWFVTHFYLMIFCNILAKCNWNLIDEIVISYIHFLTYILIKRDKLIQLPSTIVILLLLCMYKFNWSFQTYITNETYKFTVWKAIKWYLSSAVIIWTWPWNKNIEDSCVF